MSISTRVSALAVTAWLTCLGTLAVGIVDGMPEAASAQATRTNADPAQVVVPATPARSPQTAIPPLRYAGALPTFAVTSVNRVAADTPQTSFFIGVRGSDRFVAEDATLRRVIAAVFNVRDFQLVGAPAWLGTDRFAVTGKSERDAPRDQLYLMMRALLADRFQLRTHVDSRAMAVHVLERLSLDAPPGAGIVRQDCSGATPAVTFGMMNDARRGAIVPCGLNYSGNDGILVAGISMDALASMLSSTLQTTVVNRTGLEGTYSVRLDFGGLAEPLQDALALQGNQGAVFSALRSQGFRLENRSESIDVLVIDSVAQPTGN